MAEKIPPKPRLGEHPEKRNVKSSGKSERARVADVPAKAATKLDPFEKAERLSKNRKALIEKNINNLTKLKEVLDGAEKVDLENLSVKALMKLEKIYPGILLYAFTDVVGAKEKLDFENWELYKKPVAGLKLTVDFHGNQGAYDRIGAGDILPASVRCITVYPLDYRGKFDKGMGRTSTRRLGLKGRDEAGSGNSGINSGNGFFDEYGYMPIFTGDEIVIGGAKNSKSGVDMAYQKRFLKTDKDGKSELDYDAYEKSAEAEEDRKYLEKLKANDVVLRGRAAKNYSSTYDEADIQRIIEKCDGDPRVKELVEIAVGFAAALKRYPKGFKGPYEYRGRVIKHAADCGKWVAQIRRMAGFNSPVGRVVFNGQAKYSGRDYRGHEAKPEQLRNLLKPGDWIWYYNGNQYWRGLHSAMFLGWKDKENLLADCASGDGSNKWRIHSGGTDLNMNHPKGRPVVWINKPFV